MTFLEEIQLFIYLFIQLLILVQGVGKKGGGGELHSKHKFRIFDDLYGGGPYDRVKKSLFDRYVSGIICSNILSVMTGLI